MGNVSKIISQNKKYAVDVYRKDITEWDENEQFCVTEYTVAVSEKQAINQVRHRVKQKYGWRDHDNRYGSATTRFIFIAKEVIEEKSLNNYQYLILTFRMKIIIPTRIREINNPFSFSQFIHLL